MELEGKNAESGVKNRASRPKILGLKQLLAKKYEYFEGLSEPFVRSLGNKLTTNFIMTVWGESGNGKSNFIMQLLPELMKVENVLYVSLEEGHEATMQLMALRHLNETEHSGSIKFADASMTYDALFTQLKKKKQPKFIVIDSVQYWNIDYAKYRRLKEAFPRKSFLFISHAQGKNPDGKTADKIRYDSGLKIRIEGYVAFVKSRYNGNKPYVIWEGDKTQGAMAYWGKNYKNVIAGKSNTLK